MAPPLLRMRGIRQRFPGVLALDGVDFELAAGEIRLLAGENGAGKSTLMKILAGVFPPDEGVIELHGVAQHFASPGAALRAGIAMIYQEQVLAPHLSIAENLALGHEPRRGPWLDRRTMARRAAELLAEVGLDLSPATPVGQLGVAPRQLVEIAKALAWRSQIMILDEPTACLTRGEGERLFALLRRLRERGVGLIYISHRLEEFRQIGDRVTVLRDGRLVATAPIAETSHEQLIRWLVGRAPGELFPPRPVAGPEPALVVRDLRAPTLTAPCSLTVHGGEIVGLGGLMGAGRTELARAIFGADPRSGGSVQVQGRELPPGSPRAAIAAGLGLVTEERALSGLALPMSVRHNVTLASLGRFGRYWLNFQREREASTRLCAELRLRAAHDLVPVGTLSGGNQQKVVLAKWLCAGVRVLIADEPTRGIDVGARQEVYRLLAEFAAAGGAILLISSDLPELLGLSHRVLVMRQGQVVAELANEQLSQETVMAAALPLGRPSPGVMA